MPKLPVFGRKGLTGACKDLGFTVELDKGKGGHALAKHPTKKPTNDQRPFVTIKGDKEYHDPNFRSALVNQIVNLGFTREEVIKAINNNR